MANNIKEKVFRDLSITLQQFLELQWVSRMIIDRAIESLANCLFVTMLQAPRVETGFRHHLFFEGGIATNPFILPNLKNAIMQRIVSQDLYEICKSQILVQPELYTHIKKPVSPEGSCLAEELDLSVIGAVTSIMAK